MLESQVHVRECLGLDPLCGIDDEQRTFACGEGSAYLVREVNVPGSVDQIQLVGFTVARLIFHPDSASLDCDALLAFQIH